jgi:phosphatidylserine/phosphatidylglycerophosphate/cardiolipin synthase-like enzyme
MHHKFIVLDFNTDQARAYTGSYNMSLAADTENGENLILIKDRRVATSYMVEAVRTIDHYEFRVAQKKADTQQKRLSLKKPPAAGEDSWFDKDWSDPHRIADRLLFAG